MAPPVMREVHRLSKGIVLVITWPCVSAAEACLTAAIRQRDGEFA
jgi:hypothetical protein